MNLKYGFLFLLFEINLIFVKNFEVENNNNNNVNNKIKENKIFEIILYIIFIISKKIIFNKFYYYSFNFVFMFNFNNFFESF
jgi:hypothetical protein